MYKAISGDRDRIFVSYLGRISLHKMLVLVEKIMFFDKFFYKNICFFTIILYF